jgi:hypothetical protein
MTKTAKHRGVVTRFALAMGEPDGPATAVGIVLLNRHTLAHFLRLFDRLREDSDNRVAVVSFNHPLELFTPRATIKAHVAAVGSNFDPGTPIEISEHYLLLDVNDLITFMALTPERESISSSSLSLQDLYPGWEA